MSAITRKVQWVKLRELRAEEQDLVRRRYRLGGKKLTTTKIQVVYTDGRIDSLHAPDCEWPRHGEESRMFHADDPNIDREWAGAHLREELNLSALPAAESHFISVPAPCTCGVVEAEEMDHELDRFYVTARYVRPYLGLYATRGVGAAKVKGEMPTLIRFVPRPLTLEQALEFEEVEDLMAVQVFVVDPLLERGSPRGERLALLLHAARKEA